MRNSRIAFACAAALAASGVAQSAAAAPAPIEPAAEHVEGSQLRAPYSIFAGIALVAVLVVLLLTVLDNDTGAEPLSP